MADALLGLFSATPLWQADAFEPMMTETSSAEYLAMTDAPPDRLSNNPKSPYYDEAVLSRGSVIHFKCVEKTNVEE